MHLIPLRTLMQFFLAHPVFDISPDYKSGDAILADRTAARTRSMISYWHDTVVCVSVYLSVTRVYCGARESV